MKFRLIKLLPLFTGLMLVSACASRPPAQIGVDANYVLEVTNTTDHQMAVSVDLGSSQTGVLGPVEAGQTKRFEIRDPATNDINLFAVDATKSHQFRKKVELKRGTVARVTID